MNNLESLSNIYQRLLTIERYSTTPKTIKENVAAHSWCVSLICMLIANEHPELDGNRMLAMAVIHDQEEAMCFPAGTKILTGMQGTKNIEDIMIGDYVLSYNFDTMQKELRKVLNIGNRMFNEIATISLSNGNELIATADHPVFVVDKGWITCSNLCIGDKLIQKRYNGLALRVYNIRRRDKTVEEIYGKRKGAKLRKLSYDRYDRLKDVLTCRDTREKAYQTWLHTKVEYPAFANRAIRSRANGSSRANKLLLLNDINRDTFIAGIENWMEKHGGRSNVSRMREKELRERIGEEKYIEQCLSHLGRFYEKPTQLELDFSDFLQEKFPNKWKYVGNYSFPIKMDGKISYPDFINNSENKIIEIFGVYWKEINYGSIDAYIDEKTRFYNSVGYEVIFISDQEFYYGDTELICDKISRFEFNPQIDFVSINSIKIDNDLQKVYNIAVDNNFNYFAQGILVHNSGDIMANLKRFHPEVRSALEDAAVEYVDIMFEGVKSSEVFCSLWMEYKEKKTKEAKFVKIADILSRIFLMRLECNMGSKIALSILGNSYIELKELSTPKWIMDEIEEMLKDIDLSEYVEYSAW